jgi:hypothetical protein
MQALLLRNNVGLSLHVCCSVSRAFWRHASNHLVCLE